MQYCGMQFWLCSVDDTITMLVFTTYNFVITENKTVQTDEKKAAAR